VPRLELAVSGVSLRGEGAHGRQLRAGRNDSVDDHRQCQITRARLRRPPEQARQVAAEPSPASLRKRGRRRGDDGTPVSSFRDLLQHLATLTLNLVAMAGIKRGCSTVLARPTALQARALDLLGVRFAV